MAFLKDTDILELQEFASGMKNKKHAMERVNEYVGLMLVFSGKRSHPKVKELEARLQEMNGRALKNRPAGSKIPMSYLLTIQHLPLMRHYVRLVVAGDALARAPGPCGA